MVTRTKPLTGAHYGLIDWLIQRVTAVLMVLYLLLLAWVFTTQASDYVGLKSIFASQWMRIFFSAGFYWSMLACLGWYQECTDGLCEDYQYSIECAGFSYYRFAILSHLVY